MESSSSSYFLADESRGSDPLIRVPMRRPTGNGNTRAGEDLSHSLFYGFDAVLNAREHKIGAFGW